MIGSGGESQQRLIAADLYEVKGAGHPGGGRARRSRAGCRWRVRAVRPLLPAWSRAPSCRGVGLFDAWTIRQRAVLNDHSGTIADVRADRGIGELVVRWGDQAARRIREPRRRHLPRPDGASRWASVLSGHGNNGDGTEGVIRWQRGRAPTCAARACRRTRRWPTS